MAAAAGSAESNAPVNLVGWARELARTQLADALPHRWAHVQSVAAEAQRIAELAGEDAELLVAAALLHDVGYASHIARAGFHPLDGARFLAAAGAPRRLTCLIARHCFAALEAEMRGMAGDLGQFEDEASVTRDALWYCDMVTGPDGQRVRFADRVAEILHRYGESDLVGQFIVRAAAGELGAAVDRTIERMTQAGIAQPRYGCA